MSNNDLFLYSDIANTDVWGYTPFDYDGTMCDGAYHLFDCNSDSNWLDGILNAAKADIAVGREGTTNGVYWKWVEVSEELHENICFGDMFPRLV